MIGSHLTVRQKEEDAYFETLKFIYFDPERDIIKANVKNSAITLVGSRRRGKSYLIRDFYYKIGKYYDKVYLFSGTADVQKDFWNFIDPKNIYEGIDEVALNRILGEQKKVIDNSKETDKTKMPHVMIIFDDIIQDNTSAKSSDFICKMYSNGRHYNILSILATQSLKKISKHARDNTDITIAYAFKNGNDKDDFVDENFSVDSNRIGKKILDSITANEDYHCIVVLNYLATKDIEKMVMRYLADAKARKEPKRRQPILKMDLYRGSMTTDSKYKFIE